MSFLLITLVISTINAQERNYKFEYLTIKDGLSHNNIYSIIQDKQGFLWIGTGNGLDRYDGLSIKSYRHDPTDANSLSSSNFGKMYQDNSGIFWFGTYGGGLDRYDPLTKTFTNYKHNDGNPYSISNNRIQYIFEDSYGIIWLATVGGGLNAFLKKEEKFIRYQHSQDDTTSIISDNVKPICEDNMGNLWIGTRDGLDYYDRDKNIFIHYLHDQDNPNSLSNNNIRTLFVDHDNLLWIGTRGGGLNIFNPITKTFKHFIHNPDKNSISENKIEHMLKDSYGIVWIGTYSTGINKYDPKTGKFEVYEQNIIPGKGISHNRIEYIYEDRSKILWIGTRGGGINKIDLKPRKFENIIYGRLIPNMLPHPSVWTIVPDGTGNVWIGTDGGGIAQYNLETKKFIKYLRHNYNSNNSLVQNRVWSMLAQSPDTIWIGTYENGLNRLIINNNNYDFKLYEHNPYNDASIAGNQINALLKDSKGNLWIGTQNGISRAIFKKNQNVSFVNYKYEADNDNTLSDNYVSVIYEDKNNQIWVGSYIGGLNKYIAEQDYFKRMKITNNSKDIDNYRVQSLYEDKWNRFWVGTEGGGLYKFNRKNNSIIQYLNVDAHYSNVIMAIQEDKKGKIWLSTTDGISKFDPETEKYINYDISDGLKTHGYNRNSSFQDKNSIIYFGSIDGITYFNPDNVIDNQNIPPIVITDFKVFNQSIYDENSGSLPIPGINENIIELDFKDYIFSFEFASLDYTVPSKNAFKYKMEGLDDKWIDLKNHRFATFTKLSPGKYVFHVKGSNNDGIWNNKGDKVTVIIKPPFWKTKLFIILEIIAILTIILLLIYLRERKLIGDKKLLESRVSIRTQEIQQQKEKMQSQAEKLVQINEELEEYSVILRETDNAVSVMNSKGDYQWINEGFTNMYGYTLDELVKDKGHRKIGSNSNLKIKDLINIWFGEKKTIIYQSENLNKNGEKIWAQTTLTPVVRSSGQVEKLIAIDSNISKIKKAEEIIIQKNENITDSIEYAKRIQQAILPPVKHFKNSAEEYFLIYKPKEIISGDFYWITNLNSETIIVIADCTGHGVPGAFMSMLGITLLNKIVSERAILEPANILNRLRIDVMNSLRQTGDDLEAKDGMDISVIKINNETKKIIFAGAMNNGILLRNGEIIALEANKMPIGIHQNAKLPFKQIELEIQNNDKIYLLSDGYVDQFGGEKSKKFKNYRFKELLLEIENLNMSEQKMRIIKKHEEWKGNEEQVDDIVILGLKF